MHRTWRLISIVLLLIAVLARAGREQQCSGTDRSDCAPWAFEARTPVRNASKQHFNHLIRYSIMLNIVFYLDFLRRLH